MGKRKEVNWDKNLKQWFKTIDRKKYYLGAGKGVSDRASRRLAIEKVRKLQQELGKGTPVRTAKDIKTPKKKITRNRKKTAPKRKWNPKQVTSVRNKFIKEKKRQADVGDITVGRVQNLEGRLKHFVDTFGTTKLSSITATDITRWSTKASKRVANGDIAPRTLQQEYNAVKQMYKYAYKEEIINSIPRNLDDLGKQTRIQKMRTKKKRHLYFDKKEIQELYESCSLEHMCPKWKNRTDTETQTLQFAILLALNTGMTQQDLSDLEVGDCALTKRPPRILRQRSKTGVESNHLLWRKSVEGLKILCKGKKKNALVFTRKDGRPLVIHSVNRKGVKTGGRSDVLGASFKRLVKRVFGDTDERRFRELRRTGAEMCSKRMGRDIAELYLAHADGKVSSAYITSNQKEFDKMLTYLEVDMGFETTLQKLPKRGKSR